MNLPRQLAHIARRQPLRVQQQLSGGWDFGP